MTDDLVEQFKAIDQAVLTDVVRKAQQDSELVLLDWTVEPLNHEKIIDTTGGLFCFSGQSQSAQGIRPWKVVMKCINNPKEPTEQPRVWYYWKREILAFQSGFLAQLPLGIRAPRFYGVIENENGAWIWMEHIQETTGKPWSLEYFWRAARQLGSSQGKYLVGTPLVDQPWLSQTFFRNVWNKEGWWSGFMNPSSAENAWQSPITQRGFDDRQKSRVLQLIEEKEDFFDANYRLPQVLCHNDASRRNFMWSRSAQTGEEELVGIDWAFSGIGALGNDLGGLVGTSMFFFDYNPMDAEMLEAAQLEGYLAGLADNAVKVDPRLVRLGYLIALSLWMGTALPGWAAVMLPPNSGFNVQAMYGRQAEEILEGWVRLDEFCLDRADEARSLIQQLAL
jgi:phosphotransferase family enzyme